MRLAMSKKNKSSTVIAHNGSGYDNKFILKYCLDRGAKPEPFIRQCSKIAYMKFNHFNVRFVDSYNFFTSGLRAIPSTYGIDTIQGFLPHHFNRPENQDYVGPVPKPEMFGAATMHEDELNKEFQPWSETQKNIED